MEHYLSGISVKQRWIYRVVLFCLILLAGAWAGCKRKPEEPKFYYYPSLNVYYDVAHNRFAYTMDGGKTWQYKTPASPTAPNTIAKKVPIESTIPEPWLHNGEHRQKYHGVTSDFEALKNRPAPPKPVVKKKKPGYNLTPYERERIARHEERLRRREARRAKMREDFERLKEKLRRR